MNTNTMIRLVNVVFGAFLFLYLVGVICFVQFYKGSPQQDTANKMHEFTPSQTQHLFVQK